MTMWFFESLKVADSRYDVVGSALTVVQAKDIISYTQYETIVQLTLKYKMNQFKVLPAFLGINVYVSCVCMLLKAANDLLGYPYLTSTLSFMQ